MMRVCVVWDADYPWDVRVEKFCTSLVAAGAEVRLVCRNRRRRKRYENAQGIHIHRLAPWTAALRGFFSFPFFLNPVWIWAIFRTAAKYRADAILVRDLPLALSAILVGKIRGVPCFLDMAEPYPEMLEGYRVLQKRTFVGNLLNSVVRNSRFAAGVEKQACRRLTHIFPVSEEMRQNLVRKGVPGSKITVVHNTPRLGFLSPAPGESERRRSEGNDPVSVIYVGDLTEARGLPLAIRAVAALRGEKQNFQLVIVGSGRYEGQLKALVRELSLEDRVVFRGWVNHEDLPRLFAEADIGLIPHLGTAHNNLTLPNKVFDIMASGKPLVSANLLPIVRIVEESEAGMIFREYSVEALKECLLALRDGRVRRELGDNGRRAVEDTYHWEKDFEAFSRVLRGSIRSSADRSGAGEGAGG